MEYLVERLKEKSTWAGIVGIIGVFGITLGPEQVEAISIAGVAIAGVVSVFLKEKKD